MVWFGIARHRAPFDPADPPFMTRWARLNFKRFVGRESIAEVRGNRQGALQGSLHATLVDGSRSPSARRPRPALRAVVLLPSSTSAGRQSRSVRRLGGSPPARLRSNCPDCQRNRPFPQIEGSVRGRGQDNRIQAAVAGSGQRSPERLCPDRRADRLEPTIVVTYNVDAAPDRYAPDR